MSRSTYSPETLITNIQSKTDLLEDIKATNDQANAQLTKLDDIINRISDILALLPIPDSGGRARVTIETGTLPTVTTVGTVTTATTVSNLTALHGFGSLTTNISNPILLSYYLGQIAETLLNGLTVENYGHDGVNFRPIKVDTSGQSQITMGTKIAGEDLTNDVLKVEERFNYTNVATAATTVIKGSAGFLHAITINTPLANGTLTIYDNTAGSGTKIGTITLPAALVSGATTLFYNCSFGVGLTIVGATANIDYTVMWR